MSQSSPDWKQRLVRSLHLSRSKLEARYYQVATIDEQNNVHNRTVVFRGFENNLLLSITDKRSDKFEQLKANKQSQICWYFAKTREQYRLSCHVNLIEEPSGELVRAKYGQDLRQKVWHGLSPKAQTAFLSPQPKAAYVATDSKLQATINNSKNKLERISVPVEVFTLMIFTPYYVDYLHLGGEQHTRIISRRDEQNRWSSEQVHA